MIMWMPITSAGLLTYRIKNSRIEVLLVHPGGPYWARKDSGAWSIPKGEVVDDEDELAAARREFLEELGVEPPVAEVRDLGEVRQANGKRVSAWAVEGDVDVTAIVSNSFEIEWPPRSGRRAEFPEVDRAEWFGLDEAAVRINAGQVPLLDRLSGLLAAD